MAISLVTGFAGQAHVTPAQDGAGYAGIVGTGCYVTKTGRMLEASMSTANKCVVCDGDAWMQGRHVRVEAGTTEELTVQSGSQGTKRNDLVVVRYARDASTGVETASLVVVKGTPGTTATDPAYNGGSVLDGTSPVDMPLYRIPIDGIAAGKPVPLFSVLAPMSELQDSISQTPRVYQGAKVFTGVNGHLVDLVGSLGSAFPGIGPDPTVYAQNGNWDAVQFGLSVIIQGGHAVCVLDRDLSDAQIQINYVVVG